MKAGYRRAIAPALAALIVTSILFSAAHVFCEDKEADVILCTVDIDKPYKILGLVNYRSSELDVSKIHSELKKQAKKMGADYVVGLTFYSNAGYLYGSGTAVKLIREDKSAR